MQLRVGTLNCRTLNEPPEKYEKLEDESPEKYKKLEDAFSGTTYDFITLTETRREFDGITLPTNGSKLYANKNPAKKINGTGFLISPGACETFKKQFKTKKKKVEFVSDRLSYIDMKINSKNIVRIIASYAPATPKRKRATPRPRKYGGRDSVNPLDEYETEDDTDEEEVSEEDNLAELLGGGLNLSEEIPDPFDKHLENLEKLLVKESEGIKVTLIVAGDFNAIVGEVAEEEKKYGRVLVGLYGSGIRRKRGDKLVAFCRKHYLRIQNTGFSTEESERYTWTSSRNPDRRNQIDFILSSASEDVLTCTDSKVLAGFDYNEFPTDHRPVIAHFNINVKVD